MTYFFAGGTKRARAMFWMNRADLPPPGSFDLGHRGLAQLAVDRVEIGRRADISGEIGLAVAGARGRYRRWARAGAPNCRRRSCSAIGVDKDLHIADPGVGEEQLGLARGGGVAGGGLGDQRLGLRGDFRAALEAVDGGFAQGREDLRPALRGWSATGRHPCARHRSARPRPRSVKPLRWGPRRRLGRGRGCAMAANGVTAKDSAPAILRYGETKVFPPVNHPHKAMFGYPVSRPIRP